MVVEFEILRSSLSLRGEKSKCSVMGLASLRKCPGYRPDPFFLVVVQNPHVQVIIYEV